MEYGKVTRGKKPTAAKQKVIKATAPAVPSDNPPVAIQFEGLLIGHFESGIYYVGVLPTLGHQFSVVIEEYLAHTTIPPFRIPLAKREIVFNEVPLEDRKWTFDVEQSVSLPDASIYLSAEPDRMNPPVDIKDYRWAIRLEDRRDFPLHDRNIHIEKNALRPVIQFKHGVFYNRGAIPNVFRVPEGKPWEELGTIGESIFANLETIEADAKMVLKIERTGGVTEEIFRVTYHPAAQYLITIRNTSLGEQAGSPLSRGHFQIYYLAAHADSPNRYDLRLGSPPSVVVAGSGAPSPYRCGIGDVGQPIL
jgi:hypothetical protein